MVCDQMGVRGRGIKKVVMLELASEKNRKICWTNKIVQGRPRGGKLCVRATGGAAWLGKEKKGQFLELTNGEGRIQGRDEFDFSQATSRTSSLNCPPRYNKKQQRSWNLYYILTWNSQNLALRGRTMTSIQIHMVFIYNSRNQLNGSISPTGIHWFSGIFLKEMWDIALQLQSKEAPRNPCSGMGLVFKLSTVWRSCECKQWEEGEDWRHFQALCPCFLYKQREEIRLRINWRLYSADY